MPVAAGNDTYTLGGCRDGRQYWTGRACAGLKVVSVVMARVIMGVAAGCPERHAQQVVDAADGAAHISSGDLLRAEVARGSEVGRQVAAYTARRAGPDELILAILVPAVVAVARDSGGYVPDGFPRTMRYALRPRAPHPAAHTGRAAPVSQPRGGGLAARSPRTAHTASSPR